MGRKTFIDGEQMIRDWLCDAKSERIFEIRKDFSNNRNVDFSQVFDGVCHSFSHLKSRLAGRTYAIYGAGGGCKRLCEKLSEFGVLCNCAAIFDSSPSKSGNEIMGVEITQFNKKINFDLIVVSPTLLSINGEIEKYLMRQGISRSRIIKFCEYIAEDDISQYFDEVSTTHFANEVFIDGGCFDFATSARLIKHCDSTKKIYAVEANGSQIPVIQAAVDKSLFTNVEIINGALWSERTILNLAVNEFASASRISDATTGIAVDAYTIDGIVGNGEKVTFIKLDIEGAELEALKGAAETIASCRPKLAISVYHKPFDYIEIPLYLKSLVPDYKAYLRHYTTYDAETVLYCI